MFYVLTKREKYEMEYGSNGSSFSILPPAYKIENNPLIFRL